MPWFKIDDGFWSHPKVLELSDEAVALWVRAGSYCAGHLTDGTVKTATLRVLGADRDSATELVMAGLWDQAGETWSFHDWDKYQPSREQVEEERRKAADRMREVRANRKRTFGGSSPNPDPTRPDPTLSTSNEVESTLSPFCYAHPTGTDKPCKRCANQRMRYEANGKAEKSKPTSTPKRNGDCLVHNWPLPCPKCAEDS